MSLILHAFLLSRDGRGRDLADKARVGAKRRSFISSDLHCMCEHEFNLVALIPVEPRHVCFYRTVARRCPRILELVVCASVLMPAWPARTISNDFVITAWH